MSVFNTKGTLLKWLTTLDQSLKDGVLESVTVNSVSEGVITLSFNFADGSVITTPQIDLPQGPQGPQGVPGADGTDGTNGTDGTDGRDALVQNRALSSAHITSPMAVPIEALNRTAVVGESIVMFATDTTENKTYMLIGTVTRVGSPGVNPYVFVTYSSKIDITGMTGPAGEAPAGTVTQSTVIERPEELPTATADSPDFVEVGGVLYRKKAVEGGGLQGTWVWNSSVNPTTNTFNFSFTSNDTQYTGIRVYPEGRGAHIDYLKSNGKSDNASTGGPSVYEEYKTIQITDISALTNEAEFTSWLTANATKQGGGGGTGTYSYVALADAT